jgi:sugar phosphate isomerase/epimerase
METLSHPRDRRSVLRRAGAVALGIAGAHFELDLFWSWYPHRDPVGLIAQLGDRIRQFHVKDMRFVNGVATFADPGAGVIDFERIFAAAGSPNRHEYIIERDDAGAAALTTAQLGFDPLKDIRF